MIGLHRFTYNGYSSQDFDLLCDLAFDSDEGESSSYLNREAVASETYNGTLRRVHNYKYSEIYAPTVTLVKNDFSDFNETEVRRILGWLTSSNTPKFLTAYYDDSEVVSFEILGAPTDITLYKIANNRIVGIVFVFESSAPYAFSAIKTVEKDITTPQTFTISCNSDELGALVYPKVTITQSNNLVVQANKVMTDREEHIIGTVYQYENMFYWIAPTLFSEAESYEANTTYYIDNNGIKVEANPQPTAENFTSKIYYIKKKDELMVRSVNDSGFDTTGVSIENITTNSKTTVGGNISQEIVILDGANRVVAANRENRIFGNDFNWQWMPLTPGENTITVTGSCTIKFEWREPRKVGF
jgi:hypothetical protein